LKDLLPVGDGKKRLEFMTKLCYILRHENLGETLLEKEKEYKIKSVKE